MEVEKIEELLRTLVKPFVRAGGYSYAVYIFHWPLLVLSVWLFKDYYKASFWILLSVIILSVGFVVSISWAAEKKLQPLMASLLDQHYYAK